MDILLIAGLWLDGSVWDDVAAQLRARGHRAVPVTLPGQGDGNTSATLADQSATVVAALDAAAGRPVVVGAFRRVRPGLARRRRPPRQDQQGCPHRRLPLPGRRDILQRLPPSRTAPCPSRAGASSKGRTPPIWTAPQCRPSRRLRSRCPKGVTRGVIRLADERRYDVPVVLICPEFTPAQAREWIDQGEVPELAKSKHLSFLDIDSGHWPMISAPADLARLLSQAAEES